MTVADRWLLPDGIDEVLPPDATKLETVRRELLDLFARWGYELVIPPMVEFLESLLTGSGSDVDLQTFRITDRLSGRDMGLRADITPQVARIDAHSLSRECPTRLCYAETVVHATADNMLASRIPIRIGAELFGHEGKDSDLEIISLMVESLQQLDFSDIHLELGDVGIYTALIADIEISDEDESRLFQAIQRKAHADVANIVADLTLSSEQSAALEKLPLLVGRNQVLTECDQLMGKVKGVGELLNRLEYIEGVLETRFPQINVHFDLSELRGYNYHTGIVFAAYLPGYGQVAKGGRYDQVGEVFGRARPATGFDMDLKLLSSLVVTAEEKISNIFVSYQPELSSAERDQLWLHVKDLRADGAQVTFELAGQTAADDSGYTSRLSIQNGKIILDEL